MPKFDANLTMLFSEVDFLDRFAAAAKAGFTGVEYLSPYAHPAAEVAGALRAAGLEQVLFNLPSGDWAAGERGIACLPDRVNDFREGVGKALEYAAALGCTRLNCLAGKMPAHMEPARARQTLVENLRFAATELSTAGITLVVEPVNTYDIPGFFLSGSRQALEIMDDAGADNLKLQYDIYHMQRMEGELAATMQKHLARIGHVQLADNPGRHEPGTGEINYPFLFDFLDRVGYAGWIGCEYIPAGATAEGLAWATSYLRPARTGALEHTA
ncbi:MAG: hydroxypyruvate isomerase [Candidatus Eremiobacteraeota bacterium]|nr:hydroxypyruvate isomerase [Candidatus Eremiobacteraeota bacterium]